MERPIHGYFSRYLLLYLLVIIIVSAVFCAMTVRRHHEEVAARLERSLDRSLALMDNQFGNLIEIVSLVAGDPDFTPFRASQSPLAGQEIIQELRQYAFANELISDIVISYPSLDQYYSTDSSFMPITFPVFFPQLGAGNEPFTHRGYLDPASGAVFDVHRETGTLLIHFNVPALTENPKFILTFLLNTDSLDEYMNAALSGSEVGISFLTDREGTAVYPFMAGESPHLVTTEAGSVRMPIMGPDPRKTVDENAFDSSRTIPFAGYLIKSAKIYQMPVRFLVGISTRQVMREVWRDIVVITLSALLAFGLGAFALYFIAIRNSRPVWELRRILSRQLGHELSAGDEISGIREAVSELGERLEDSREALKHGFLQDALIGTFRSRDTLDAAAEACGIRLEYPYLFVAFFQSMDEELDGSRRRIIESMEEMMPQGMDGFGDLSPEPNRFTFIFSSVTKEREELGPRLAGILAEVKRLYGCDLFGGVGTRSDNPAGFPKSCLSALTVIRYGIFSRSRRVMFVGNIKFQDRYFNVHLGDTYEESMHELYLSVMSGNDGQTRAIVDRITGELARADISQYDKKNLIYEIYGFLFKLFRELGLNDDEESRRYLDWLFQVEIVSIEEVRGHLVSFSRRCCEAVNTAHRRRRSDRFSEIVEYLESAFGRYSTTVETLAERFGMSRQSLNSLFKERIRVTVSEYLRELRIKKAEDLLRTTEKPVKEVVQEVGYADVSSFIRHFKRSRGMTPGTFRSVRGPTAGDEDLIPGK